LTYRTFWVAALVTAAVVTGLSIAQAVSQDSLDPIVVIAWVPAVLIGAGYWRSASDRHCSRWLPRRRQF
jgi:hypothetical protein